MQFSCGAIAPLIIQPLRYHFSNSTSVTNMIWHPDEKQRTVDIGEAFDFNKIALGEKPRIIVSRGNFSVGKVGLTDNLAQGPSIGESQGNKNSINMVLYQGAASINIETRNKGTCELLTDMVSHFIIWTRPAICDSQGWKEFGMGMSVSDVQAIQDEDQGVPKFQATIIVPWMKEEHWKFSVGGLELKKVLSSIKPQF